MTEEKSYRTIVKTTSLFGGVQIFQIILNLIRGKVIAILLGSSGMGLNSMFMSSMAMVNNISSLGLNFSAVREISQSAQDEDHHELSKILKVFRRWLFILAPLGVILTFSLSSLLSKLSFGSSEYTIAFMCLSIMPVLNLFNIGNTAILQGTRRLKSFAKLALIGSVVSLIVSIPLYYRWGAEAIVPVILITAFINLIFSCFYASKIKTDNVSISWKETFGRGAGMIKLGTAMMLSASMGTLVGYLVNSFIITTGSLSDLGLYQAGMSITNQSIGLVFTAMSVDYFPRLAAISGDNTKVRIMTNQQAEITILLAAPILVLLILVAPLLIRLLLSQDFIIIESFIRVLAFGMYFKAASYAIGAISFAKGDKRIFLIMEGGYANASMLICNIVGYWLGGLTGLAVSFLVSYLAYFIIINIVMHKLYSFSLSSEFRSLFIPDFVLICSVLLLFLTIDNEIAYIIGSIIALITIAHSYIQLNRRINIKDIISQKLKKKI